MSRSVAMLVAVLTAAGCGSAVLSPLAVGGGAMALPGNVAAAPDAIALPEAAVGTGPYQLKRGVGYYWLGYSPASVGMGDIEDAGAGNGLGAGVGLKFAESTRTFFELSFEKTVDHEYPSGIQTGYIERVLAGGRSAAAALARLEMQPRPYVSYGISTNTFRVDTASGYYQAKGVGLYAGMGVEFPIAKKLSFSFDAKYHFWSDKDANLWYASGVDGDFADLAFGLFWLGRF